ncbi:MAG: D-glycero-beta-D-manno-heptose-7-phosphate kinase [Deltaproteobacteria bacterium]|nr:D-glycero-beta-D-manno-heptose-7-phosphate kinase [Deltaproteobacteria bacterium]
MKNYLTLRRAKSIIKGFNNSKVLVIGDMIVDHFIWGSVRRISPEAPVPVVDVTEETIMLGGAGNVGANIRSLDGRCSVVSVAGRDEDGEKLNELLSDIGIKSDGIVTDKDRPTTIKTRIVAHHQQVVRFDREMRSDPKNGIIKKIEENIKKAARSADVIVISDYAKGLISSSLVEFIVKEAKKKPVFVDPRVEGEGLYKGATLITPNSSEASLSSGVDIKDEKSLKEAARELRKRYDLSAVLITRGEHGMSLFEDKRVTNIPTVAREVFDVSGAGDTVIGVMALSVAAGASMREAAVLANFAGGIVVGKLGTATVTPVELIEAAANRLGRK